MGTYLGMTYTGNSISSEFTERSTSIRIVVLKLPAAAQRLQISDGTFEELRQDRLSKKKRILVLTGPNVTHV